MISVFEFKQRNTVLREATIEDLPAIHALDPARAQELTPGPTTLNNVVVTMNDRIIAYGAVKIVAELVIATDKEVHALTRARTIETMMDLAKHVCGRRPLEELIAFTDDERYSEFLVKRIGFQKIKKLAFSYTLR